MLEEGSAAPTFTLPNQDGAPVRLEDQRGKWVLLWWYPAADTPGCTLEGKTLRDMAPEFAARDCTVLGVSFDGPEANRAFREKFGFPFDLLCDESESVGVAYHTRKPGDDLVHFARRLSYLIDPAGRVARAYKVSDIAAHPPEVLADLDSLR